MTDFEKSVVIDNGSGFIKYGFSSSECPNSFPSVVGVPKYQAMQGSDMDAEKKYIGDDAIKKRGVLSLKYPIEEGIVKNWDEMELVWNHLFYNELRCEPSENPVHLTEAPKNPTKN